MPAFLPGIELNRRFYWEAVRPLLDARFEGVAHSVALMGYGSDVLGFDTPRSTDHEWGPRGLIFLADADHQRLAQAMRDLLARELPPAFMGYSTDFGDPDGEGLRRLTIAEHGPIRHHIEILSIRRFWMRELGIEPFAHLKAIDWLCFPEQKLLAITGGAVFYDGLRQLASVRERFSAYPSDVWMYLLSAQWRRISQEEAFVARCAEVGDELGSRIIAARLVRDVMKLCFLMERRFAPYIKWFGASFSTLVCAQQMVPILERVLSASTIRERADALSAAYTLAAEMHNALGITNPIDVRTSRYYSRPFLVIHAVRFADAIRSTIGDPEVLALLEANGQIGGIDQFADSSDVLSRPMMCNRLKTALASNR